MKSLLRSRRKKLPAGFTAIEVIMTILVMGIALPPLLLLLYNGLKSTVTVHEDRVAAELSRSLLEEMRSKSFSDVDAYNGRSEAPVTGYTDYRRTAAVYYVDLSSPVETSHLDDPASGLTKYKRLAVTTTPAAGNPVTLVTVIASRE